jgi:uncharacterized membrane protein YfcA
LNNALLVGIGLIAGVLGGLLGIGGAVIIIPALVLFLGYSQYEAQGTTLAMLLLPVSALAAFQYYRGGYVDVRAALIMGVMFLVGGYLGAKLATQMPVDLLKKIFAVVLIVIAVKMLFDKSSEL